MNQIDFFPLVIVARDSPESRTGKMCASLGSSCQACDDYRAFELSQKNLHSHQTQDQTFLKLYFVELQKNISLSNWKGDYLISLLETITKYALGFIIVFDLQFKQTLLIHSDNKQGTNTS